MAVLLMSLRHVPADEAEEVRALLRDQGFAFYETPPGRWGISAGGLWLHEHDELPRAKVVLAAYQQDRQARARAIHARHGREPFSVRLRRNPLGMVLRLLGIVVVLYLFLLPLLLLSRGS